MALSRDGRHASTVDVGSGSARVWDVDTGTYCFLPGPVHMVRTAAFSSDGKYLATAGSGGIARVWELSTGTYRSFPDPGGGSLVVAVGKDGRRLAGAGGC